MLFHIEDEYRQREYNWNSCAIVQTTGEQINKIIAEEIRKQINGSNNRSVFSASKCLGTVLFKYNQIMTNPLHLIKMEPSFVDFSFINEYGRWERDLVCFYLDNPNYFERRFGRNEIRLNNYVIDISNDKLIHEYLKESINIGKKYYAACEKDQEVIVRHITNQLIITEEFLDAVYFLYGLNVCSNFLFHYEILNLIISELSCITNDEEIIKAFYILIQYLVRYGRYDFIMSLPNINPLIELPRFYQDAYTSIIQLFNKKINKEYRLLELNDYIIHYNYSRLVDIIWNLFINNKEFFVIDF